MSTRSANRFTSISKLVSNHRSGLKNIYDKSILGAVNARSKPPFYIKWMIVGGGGEGGAGKGAGGGGGGIVIGIHYMSPTGNLTYGTPYSIGVGGGGGYSSGRGGSGGDSSFLGFTAYGGGGGGGVNNPGANTECRPGGSGGGEPNSLYTGGYGIQGGLGGVKFIMQGSRPYGGYGSTNDNQGGDGDRHGRGGNDSTWYDDDYVYNKSKNLNPAYAAPGPLSFRGYGGGGGGAGGFDIGLTAGESQTEGGAGGDGYAYGFESNFLTPTNPISSYIWGISYGGGGSSSGYENNNRQGYNGPSPSVYPQGGGVKTGYGSVKDAGDSWTGAPNWSPNGDGIGFNPSRGNPGDPWYAAPLQPGPATQGNAFPPFGWKSGFGENTSPGGPAPLPYTTPAGYYSMNGLPNSGQGGGGRWNGSSNYQWGARGPFWGSDSHNPGAPNWLGRAGANTGGKGGSGVVFITYPQVFGNVTNTGAPDLYITPEGFRIYTFRGGGSITFDYER